MKNLLASSAALILCAGAGTAFAADDDGDGYDDITGEAVSLDDSDESSADDDDGGDTSSGGGMMSGNNNGGGGGDGGKYKMGISVPLIGFDFSGLLGDEIQTANLLWAVGENWLELGVGLSVEKTAGDPTTTPPTEDETAVGFLLRGGYRMMKPTKGRVMPFLKPFLEFGISNFSAAGDTIILGAGATLGVDVLVFDQFTLGAQIGAGFRTSDAFNTFAIATDTSTLNATIWW